MYCYVSTTEPVIKFIVYVLSGGGTLRIFSPGPGQAASGPAYVHAYHLLPHRGSLLCLGNKPVGERPPRGVI